MPGPALSFVIPLYNSAGTIPALVAEIAALRIPGGHEIVLVDDASADGTAEICRRLVAQAAVPMTFVAHARNYGEHNAVLTGWRQARGAHLVNLDDDGQNPPAEAVRLWEAAKAGGLDVVYGHYEHKQHPLWRNLGSWFTNRVTDWAIDKPPGLYLSSFRCVSAFAAREVARHSGPYPYIDGLIFQVTQRVGSVAVRHAERQAGHSGYTLRRLVRLWLSAWINFSVLPLRIGTVLGLMLALAGVAGFALVVYLKLTDQGPAFGWGSLMAALLVFSGVQLLLLGVIGEYLGRMFLTLNQRPQAVVREIVQGG
jgi:undecaprenyl-phosphate 4-deoxy-4-formamido-L-arabinose transferase